MKIVGMDVGSTTVKAVAVEDDRVLWRDYQRHGTKQAEKVLRVSRPRCRRSARLRAGRDLIFFTGSGAGLIGPLVGGKIVQEVVAVAAAVEKMHPDVQLRLRDRRRGHEDDFLQGVGERQEQAGLHAVRLQRRHGDVHRKDRAEAADHGRDLSRMPYDGMSLHKISSKCGIFAETDANTLLKGGVPVNEIIASLFEAVVYQNLATLTKGNTPMPKVLLLGGPNLFFKGCSRHGGIISPTCGTERNVRLPAGVEPADCIMVPR